jgi:hypothetical protein
VTTRADTVTQIIARNRARGLRSVRAWGALSPEDTVQNACLVLLRITRIADDEPDQDGLWVLCLRWALARERYHARQQIRRGTASNLDTVPQHLIPASPSAEDEVMRDEVSPELARALRLVSTRHREKITKRLAASHARVRRRDAAGAAMRALLARPTA